jgi:hypothetical protein
MAVAQNQKDYSCILCNKETLPKQRAYLKDCDTEPLLSLNNLLLRFFPEEQVSRCLKIPVIVCKGACQNSLRKYCKMREDIERLEKEISEKLAVKMTGQCKEQETPSTPRRRIGREELNTPTKEILSRTVSMETPSVSVCITINDSHAVDVYLMMYCRCL